MSNSSAANNDQPLAHRIGPFCKRAGICRATFYKFVGLGKIRVIKIGGRTLISAAEADRILAEGVR